MDFSTTSTLLTWMIFTPLIGVGAILALLALRPVLRREIVDDLSRVVGLRRAMDLVLTNRVLGAAEAEGWGLVNRVVPDADVVTAATALATQLAAGPTRSLGLAKRVVYEGASSGLEAAYERESLAIAEASGTADGREGIAAFLAKRAPEFGGR